MLTRRHTLRIVRLMTFIAATLAIASAVHLLGGGEGRGAGVAEAVICVALMGGAVALRRSPARGRDAALAATAFAVFGFVLGLTFTVRDGEAADLTYHLVLLPVLVWTLALILRGARPTADYAAGPLL
jgi:hypothetical protein